MKRRFFLTSSTTALISAATLPAGLWAQTTETGLPSGKTSFHPDYVETIAELAYFWGYPMVNMINRSMSLGSAPAPGTLGGVFPVSSPNRIGMLTDYIDPGQRSVACPNQDVVYGLGFQFLDQSPVVVQVPDFGDRFYVYAIYNHRTTQVGQVGAPYNTKPGMYLMVGPDWEGEIPEGMAGLIRSDTNLTMMIPRIFLNDTDEDRAAVQPLVNQVMVYPLQEYTGKMQTTDWTKAPDFPGDDSSGGETKWVMPETFFEQLPDVLDRVPALPGEEGLYAQFHALLEAAENDPEIKQAMIDTVARVDAETIPDFLQWRYNGKPAGNNWNRSLNNAEWGLDYYNRVSTSRSNMFDNRPNETQYFYTDVDVDGEPLDGTTTYAVTFAELPPVRGFWSMTLYDKEHFFHPNDLGRYSLGTKNASLQYNDDGSLTLYVGNTSPGAELETNWIPAPADVFSLYIRAYWGEPGITRGTWQPPAVAPQG